MLVLLMSVDLGGLFVSVMRWIVYGIVFVVFDGD